MALADNTVARTLLGLVRQRRHSSAVRSEKEDSYCFAVTLFDLLVFVEWSIVDLFGIF